MWQELKSRTKGLYEWKKSKAQKKVWVDDGYQIARAKVQEKSM